ncbi:MAG: sulfatase-like hydrolase/transferase, partial [Desulfobacterales bacterium]|nr:sulfatase-like hydrolase/transferase [Desulfobacterales bacterium]
ASHASLFTSTHPITNGVQGNNTPLDQAASTLAEILAEQGYYNGAFVSGYPVTAHASGLDQGFHHYDDRIFILDHLPGAAPRLCMGLSVFRALEKFMAARHLLIHLQRRGDRTNRAALKWLDTVGEGPFFLWIHYFDPHTPYDPPPPYDTMADPDYKGSADGSMETIYRIWDGEFHPRPRDVAHIISLYDGEIAFTDSLVGRIVEKLKRMKALDNTLLVIASDHGESLWEHDYYFKHGDFLYDSCVRTPLIINLPGKKAAPKRIDHPTENIDSVPTILEALEIPRPGAMQGKSLLGLVRGDNTYTKDHGFSQAIGKRHESYKIERKRYCVRTGEWKFIRNQGEADELYHLVRDPAELSNRVADHPELDGEFNVRLDEILSRIRKSRREIAPPDKETLEKLKSLGYMK